MVVATANTVHDSSNQIRAVLLAAHGPRRNHRACCIRTSSTGCTAGWCRCTGDPSATGRSLAWCPEWWRHPEAAVRLTALWRGFEQRRTEPGDSMSAWMRDHLEHHMRILNDPAGPLKGCSDDRGHGSVTALKAWRTAEPPAGLADYLA